jgi:aminobenzoyl-glutamate utilization protein B
MMKGRRLIVLFVILVFSFAAFTLWADKGGKEKDEAISWVEENKTELIRISDALWRYAETAMLEYKSSRLLISELEKAGFKIEKDVAGMPTAFIATYGEGKPVIGILAEYDALPGLSQKAVPYKEPLKSGAPGHGCGHNLFGSASVGAAIAVKHIMEKEKLPGTIRLYGTPAEETLIGKVWMARDGYFDDLDCALVWHPNTKNQVTYASSNAMNSFTVTFHGKAAHAASDPWHGRSALDAVELMNIAANFLREHVKPTVRIHYAITETGKVPNVVPDKATVWYYVRDLKREGVKEVYNRLLKIAEAASLATETTYETHLIAGIYHTLGLKSGAEIMYKNLELIGPPKFTKQEQEFAKRIQKECGKSEKGISEKIEPFKAPEPSWGGGSTDVADVSWITPTISMGTACVPEDVPWHSWAVVASSGSSIGHKGMLLAAKTIAATAIDFLTKPELLEEVRKEWEEKTEGITYKCAVPKDQPPPVLPEPREKEEDK